MLRATMNLRHALFLAFGMALASGQSAAQSAWDDPQSFGRLVENVCLNGAMIAEKADRIAMIEQLFGFAPVGESNPGAPDLENAEGFTVGWEPSQSPSLFCGLSVPAGVYDAGDVAAIADRLDGELGSPATETEPGMFGPIQRGLLDGRTMQIMVVSDPTDGLLVMGMIEN
jgi:hypothetical protein